MAIICLDPGLKHTGVAISTDGILASPLTTIHASGTSNLVIQLTPLINQYLPDIIIIGQPHSGQIVRFASSLAQALAPFVPKIILFPEDLSSKFASRHLSSTNRTGVPDHQLSASFILQDYLDQSPKPDST